MEAKWPPVRWFLSPILQRVYELIIEILRKFCCKRIQMTPIRSKFAHRMTVELPAMVWATLWLNQMITMWVRAIWFFCYKIWIMSSKSLSEMAPWKALYVTWSKVVTINNSCYFDQLSLWLKAVHLPTFSITRYWFLYQVNVVRTLLYSNKSLLDNKVHGATWGPPGSCRPQMGPMLAPWTLLSGYLGPLTNRD